MDRLPTAFFMNRMVAVVERMEKVDKEDLDAPCEMCSERKVEAICQQCPGFICGECVKSHKKLKVFSGHNVVTFEEMKAGKGRALPIQQAPPRICQVHNEQRKVYCYDCKELICRDCTLVDHAGHKYNFVVKGAPQVKTTLRDRLVPLRDCSTGIADAVKFIGDTKAQTIEKGASVDAAIKQYCKELHQIIDRRENELLKTSAALVKNNVEALSAQEKSLASSATVVQDLVEFVDQTLENATDEELMEFSDQVLKRIDEEGLKQTTLDLTPLEISTVNVCFENQVKIIETVQRSIYVPPRAISGPGLEGAAVKEPAYIHVHTVDEAPAEVKASLKSLYDHSVLQFKGERNELGKYEIAYTPVIRGRHELEIIVDGVAVYNKPLLVRIPPTQLSKPVRIIPDLKEPVGVAINSAGEVLVCEGEGGVKVFDKYGQKIRKLKRSEFNFDNPFGIAVDAADDIYVAEAGCSYISKISKEGELVKEVGDYGSGPGELDTPRGVAVVNDQLYVCDEGNHRVQVFSLDLEFISMFGKKGTGDGEFFHPQTIAADQDGLLYISDYSKNCVQVLTKEGNFVRSISGKIGDHRLTRPSGLCVVGRYLYVVHQIYDDDDDLNDAGDSSNDGDSGDDGDAGDDGDSGDAGDDGDDGDSGDDGDDGDSGDDGDAGDDGDDGDSGDDGDDGDSGDDGDDGDSGDDGDDGDSGDDGDDGDGGDGGNAGDDGDSGDAGDAGDDGDSGDAGDAGDGTVVVVLDKDSGEFVSQFGEGDLKYVDCHYISVNSDGFVYVSSENRVVVF